MQQAFDGPELQQPLVGLIQAASEPADPGPWENGFRYMADGCAADASGRYDPCTIREAEPNAIGSFGGHGEGSEEVRWEPYSVWAEYECAPIGRGAVDRAVRKATRRLVNLEHVQIEAEFWGGALAQAADPADPISENLFLAHPAAQTVTEGATAVDALACLEQYLGDCNGGQRGMIHASRQIVTLWANGGALRREGNRILTTLDTIVVPGGKGYSGSSPDGDPAGDGSFWIYATGLVEIRRGETQTLGGTELELHRTHNQQTVRVQRKAVASWDGCCHGAAEVAVDLCVTEPTEGS